MGEFSSVGWPLTLTLSHRERGQIVHGLNISLSPGERAGGRGLFSLSLRERGQIVHGLNISLSPGERAGVRGLFSLSLRERVRVRGGITQTPPPRPPLPPAPTAAASLSPVTRRASPSDTRFPAPPPAAIAAGKSRQASAARECSRRLW